MDNKSENKTGKEFDAERYSSLESGSMKDKKNGFVKSVLETIALGMTTGVVVFGSIELYNLAYPKNKSAHEFEVNRKIRNANKNSIKENREKKSIEIIINNNSIDKKYDSQELNQEVSQERPQIVPLTNLSEINLPLVNTQNTNYKTTDFSGDSDEVLLARMLFGEARNCDLTEKVAVAYTAINRANDGKKENGENLREVILSDYQYGCFNLKDSNRARLMDPQRTDKISWQKCLDTAKAVIDGKCIDPTNGATHYHMPSVNPDWAKSSQMTKIGKIKTEEGKESEHIFYKEK